MEATANLGLVRPVISEFVTVFNYYVEYFPTCSIFISLFQYRYIRFCYSIRAIVLEIPV